MKTKHRYLVVLIAISLIIMSLITTKGDTPSPKEPLETEGWTKNETVYVNLAPDGEVLQINVVNRLEIIDKGTYTDHGEYQRVVNLTDTSSPKIDQDKITWTVNDDIGSFYYQGTMKNAALPYLFSVRYEVDGQEIAPEEMPGKSGNIRILLSVTPDPSSADYFRDNYYARIQTDLDLDKNFDIQAPGAASVIFGKNMTLAYTLLPGESGIYEISYKTTDFSSVGWNIICSLFGNEMLPDIDMEAINEGFDRLSNGAGNITSGTKDLKNGLVLLSDSLDKISLAADDTQQGLEGYLGGISNYTKSINQLADKAAALAKSTAALQSSSQELCSAFSGIRVQIETLLGEMENIIPEDENKTSSITSLKETLTIYENNLNSYAQAVSVISQGMSSFAEGISQLDVSGASLVSSLISIIDGMAMFTDGLSKTASELERIPADLENIISAQTSLSSGIKEAADNITGLYPFSDLPADPVSFVSGKNTNVKTVQFIYKTPALTSEGSNDQENEKELPKKGFFEKFLDLFRK
jgi:putative membrane protein